MFNKRKNKIKAQNSAYSNKDNLYLDENIGWFNKYYSKAYAMGKTNLHESIGLRRRGRQHISVQILGSNSGVLNTMKNLALPFLFMRLFFNWVQDNINYKLTLMSKINMILARIRELTQNKDLDLDMIFLLINSELDKLEKRVSVNFETLNKNELNFCAQDCFYGIYWTGGYLFSDERQKFYNDEEVYSEYLTDNINFKEDDVYNDVLTREFQTGISQRFSPLGGRRKELSTFRDSRDEKKGSSARRPFKKTIIGPQDTKPKILSETNGLFGSGIGFNKVLSFIGCTYHQFIGIIMNTKEVNYKNRKGEPVNRSYSERPGKLSGLNSLSFWYMMYFYYSPFFKIDNFLKELKLTKYKLQTISTSFIEFQKSLIIFYRKTNLFLCKLDEKELSLENQLIHARLNSLRNKLKTNFFS